jgi:hypothetical protein
MTLLVGNDFGVRFAAFVQRRVLREPVSVPSPKERTTGMPHTRNDDELIRAIQTQTRRQDARMLREMGAHAPCTCSSKPEISSEHSPTCPLFIWHSAARALDLLTED